MRFKPYLHRPEKLEFNSRKESLFARKQQREANALPLFSDQIRVPVRQLFGARPARCISRCRRICAPSVSKTG